MDLKRSSYIFVILLGFVSLLADVCYEGARSIIGPFLGQLGADAALVAFVAGAGELIGYGIRYLSGLAADRYKGYWPLTILGYVINVAAVPLLALSGTWITASALIILERMGKAIRSAPRDAMLSYASQNIGRGLGFGIHKALDQVGALLGPIFIALILYYNGTYRLGLVWMVVPATLCILLLIVTRMVFPKPELMEPYTAKVETKGYSRQFWIYIAALCCIAFGYIDFPLIAFHYAKQNIIDIRWIPVLYGIAMAVDGLAAFYLGRLFDRLGIQVLLAVSLLSALMAPVAFAGNLYAAVFGMVLWGFGMGAQESVIKAFVAELVPPDRRGSAYGLLNLFFGLAWFLGSVLMGIVYDFSIPLMVGISVASILASIPFLLILARSDKMKT